MIKLILTLGAMFGVGVGLLIPAPALHGADSGRFVHAGVAAPQ
jgi:hypothetical protein